MQRLVTLDLWPQLGRLAEKAKNRMAAVAYVTRSVEVQFGAGDILIVDASDEAIKIGVTATAILRAAYRRGAQVFSCPGLHAKVFLLDNIAVIGSANISATSVNHKIEAALITDDRATANKLRLLIEQLTRESDKIDDKFLTRIGKIKVSGRRSESRRGEDAPATIRKASRTRGSGAFVSALNKHGIRLDNPRALSFDKKTFVFTGVFDFDTQNECARATRALGGRRSPNNRVTRDVDVLVVGTGGSPNYLWKTFGRKMARADELRQQWRKPLIISEDRWRKEIDL